MPDPRAVGFDKVVTSFLNGSKLLLSSHTADAEFRRSVQGLFLNIVGRHVRQHLEAVLDRPSAARGRGFRELSRFHVDGQNWSRATVRWWFLHRW